MEIATDARLHDKIMRLVAEVKKRKMEILDICERENAICSKSEAKRHIDNHDNGFDFPLSKWEVFLDEFGDQDDYDLTELYLWLGYYCKF